MGIDIDIAKFLLSARERTVDFCRTLMLGNQKSDFLESDYQILSERLRKEKSFANSKAFKPVNK